MGLLDLTSSCKQWIVEKATAQDLTALNLCSLFDPRLQIPAEFRPEFSNSVPIRWFCLRNYGIFIWKFRISPVFVHYVTLANRPFCTTPPLRSVPRPIGEGLSIAFWASRLSETLFSRKLTLSNFKLSFELKKKHRKWPEHRRTSGGISVRNLVPGARPIGIPPEFAT